MTLIIDPQVCDYIYKDAIETFPNECCGFLYGKEKTDRFINLAQRTNNSKDGDKSRRFEISPLDYIRAEKYALENDLQLLGIYHSHPNHLAIASKHDLEKALPFFSYLIVSIMNGKIEDLKSWKLKEEKKEFLEEEIFIQKLQEFITSK